MPDVASDKHQTPASDADTQRIEPPVDVPIEALDYPLPEAAIATAPAQPRESARLMVVSCTGDSVEHRTVADLPEYLNADDLMVFNDTAVIPARIKGNRVDSGGRVEGLFLDEPVPGTWRLMLKSNGKLRDGLQIALTPPHARESGLEITLCQRDGAHWLARVCPEGDAIDLLTRFGHTPLPPYILGARSGDAVDDDLDRTWYQTVYADPRQAASVAAPTAGLHFTKGLLNAIDDKGVARTAVTLHVGPGTFKPVTAANLTEHDMHWERYEVPKGTLDALRSARRVVAVGTTTVRTLESLPRPLPHDGISGQTDLLIAPGYQFRHIDALMTNFHLPRSTLLALVGALVGLERLKSLYKIAVDEGYRFYSYGDATLILP